MSQQPLLPAAAPVAKRRRRPLRIAIIAVVAIAIVCGGLQLITNMVNRDAWEDREGQPVKAVQVVPTPTPTWKPSNMFVDPQPLQEIRHTLESRLLRSAGIAKPVTSTCAVKDFDGRAPASFTCTLRYEGQQVEYAVLTRPKPPQLFEWEADSQQTVVTRDGILAALSRSTFGDKSAYTDLRCEDLPAVAVVPVGKPLGPVCYAKPTKKMKTIRVLVQPSDDSAVSFGTETQDKNYDT